MKNQSKRKTSKLTVIVAIIIFIFPCIYFLIDLSSTNRKANDILNSFVVGRSISSIKVPNPIVFIATFESKNNFNEKCLNISCHKDENCRTYTYEDIRLEYKEIEFPSHEIGKFISDNLANYSSCDSVQITVMDSHAPVHATFNVYYDKNGLVTSKDEHPVVSD